MANFGGINWYGDWTIEDQAIYNIISFLKWGLLEIGAYYNINKDQVNYNNANESVLQPVTFYGSGGIAPYTVYRGLQHDWVWESGVSLKYGGGTPPLTISGIYVNEVFYPTGTKITGTGYTIDYSRGQVVFHNPLSSGHTVKSPYCLRMVHVYPEESNEYRQLTTDWVNNTGGTGLYSTRELAYLPAIFVGIDGWRSKPVELGDRSKYCMFRLKFDILSNNAYEAKKLSDILYFLEEKTIPMYDLNTAPMPLNISGAITTGTKTWPELVAQYFFKHGRFIKDSTVSKINGQLPVHQRRLYMTFETVVNPDA